MQLKDLYKNFGTSTPEEQAEFISQYRLKRASELESISTVQKRKPTTRTSAKAKLTLSEEEKLLMKMLGLKQKDILAARSKKSEEEDAEENGAELLQESTFEGGEENE